MGAFTGNAIPGALTDFCADALGDRKSQFNVSARAAADMGVQIMHQRAPYVTAYPQRVVMLTVVPPSANERAMYAGKPRILVRVATDGESVPALLGRKQGSRDAALDRASAAMRSMHGKPVDTFMVSEEDGPEGAVTMIMVTMLPHLPEGARVFKDAAKLAEYAREYANQARSGESL